MPTISVVFENKLFKFFLSGCHSSEFSIFCLKLYLGYCRFVREHWLFNSFPNFLLVIYFFLNSDTQRFRCFISFPTLIHSFSKKFISQFRSIHNFFFFVYLFIKSLYRMVVSVYTYLQNI